MPGTIKQLTHGSLFAGIGGFDEGFRRSGFHVAWQVEKEPFCRAVLRTKFPESELLEDVRDCGKSNLRAVDVLTAGFPCQDLSVAGKRAGLAGARSGLFWEVVRILGELRPTWFVLENVPGLFSSNNGEDFRIVLQSLDELGYGLAWRVLDSQFFGVAQRRRRVFIVGRFGKPCPETILFESESGEGDFTESGETWSGVAAPLTSGIGITGNAPGRRREDDINLAVAGPLNTRNGHSINAEDAAGSHIVAGFNLHPVAAALSRSTGHHGHSSPRGDGSDNIIVQQAISSKWAKGTSGPAGDEHHNLIGCLPAHSKEHGHAMGTQQAAESNQIIAIQDVREMRDKKQNGIGIDGSGGSMYTLDGTSQHAIAGTLKFSNPGGCRIDAEGAADGFLQCAPTDPNGVRTFAGLPEGLDSARYRALGNAVTANVAEWIARRIVAACEAEE